MAIFYLDTSVIVKRYRNEEGTVFVDLLFDNVIGSKNHSLTTSTISILEFIATMKRARTRKIISNRHFENAVYLFGKELNHISLRPLSEDLLIKALAVVMNNSLRTADSIHLATVLEIQEMMAKFNESVILVSNDKEMCDAARDEGIEVISAADDTIDKLKHFLNIE